jgi:YihY family inner membrane protein
MPGMSEPTRHSPMSLAEAATRAVPRPVRRIFRNGRGVLVRTVHLYLEIDGEQRAASFAYYVLFSLFPLIALLLTVGSRFLNPSEIISTIDSFLPLETSQQKFIWESVTHLERSRSSIGAISVVILIWSSLRFFQALVRGVNRAWHTVEIPWWQVPLKNLFMIGITSSALFVGLLAPALLQGVRNALLAANTFLRVHFPQFNLHLISDLLDLGRYFLGGAVLFYSFLMLYKIAPSRRVLFSQVWMPALLVTVALQACQIAFVNYLPRFVDYGIYGAVGGLMLLLLWVYISGIIIIFGGCLCAAMGQDEDNGKPPTPPSSEN